MSLGNPIQALTRAELDAIANPSSLNLGESIPGILFDTQTYTSGTTTTLTFFRANQTDPTLSNMTAPGQLADPQYFQIFQLGLDILNDATTAAGAEVGALDDIQKLVYIGRGTFSISISDKTYPNGAAPISFLHCSGGAQGNGYGTFTAEESIQVGNNSFPGSGWNWFGSVVIPPKVGFSVTLNWTAAQTLAFGNTPLRFWMLGTMHRRAL